MLWLFVVLLFLLSGYAVLLGCGISMRNLAADVALAWFCGTAWYTFASCVMVFVLGLEPALWKSAVIFAFPVALAVAYRPRRLRPELEASFFALRTTRWWPRQHGRLWVVPVAAAAVVLTLVFLHGKNTPTNTDDAVRLRAYTPMLVYQGDLGPSAASAIFGNGDYMSFGPLPAWQLRGTIHHFDVNYFILTSVLCFCGLIYAICASRGAPEQGLATVFLLTTVPLFAYHATSTYLDAVYSIMFAGALFFLALEAEAESESFRRGFLLFVLLTAGVKNDGEIVAITVLAVFMVLTALRAWRSRSLPWRSLVMGLTPLAVYLVIKNVYQPNPLVILASRVLAQKAGYVPAVRETATAVVDRQGADLAQSIFWHGLFTSGNFGIIFYIFAFFVLYSWRAVWKHQLMWPLIALALVFAEVYVNAVAINPKWTLDGATVNRSQISVAVGCAVLLGFLWARHAALVPPINENRPHSGADVNPGRPSRPKRRRKRG